MILFAGIKPRACGVLLLCVWTLSACTNYEYHESVNVPISQLNPNQEQQILEEELLDVGIVLFDPGEIDRDRDDVDFSSVRNSEAVWFTQQLKRTLENSNAWGMVRSLPEHSLPMDLIVKGEILKSNG